MLSLSCQFSSLRSGGNRNNWWQRKLKKHVVTIGDPDAPGQVALQLVTLDYRKQIVKWILNKDFNKILFQGLNFS